MTQIIEKLAQACRDARAVPGCTPTRPSDTDRKIARAIIQHLRDNPTPEMMAEGVEAYALHTHQNFTTEDAATAAVWSAILNTALGEE